MDSEHSLDLFGVAWRLGATLFFVALNGFFVAAEFALVKARRSRIQTLADAGSTGARVTEHILSHLDRYLSACQLGITLASLVLGALGEPAVAVLLLAAAHGLGWDVPADDPLFHVFALIIAFTFITILHMTVGEQAPKMWALARSEKTSVQTAIPLRIFATIFQPFIAVVNSISNWMLRVAGLEEGHAESSHTTEEIRHILSRSAEAGSISERVWELSENVFTMIEMEVRHILVPRVDCQYVSVRRPLEENLATMRAGGHSRFPLCDDGLDSVIGILHVRDLFAAGDAPADLRALAHPAVFVPDTKPLSELIVELQRRRAHVAMVVDERGTCTGMVFLEDAIEKIVGPLADEFDEPPRRVRELSPGTWELGGGMPLPEAESLLGLDLEHADEDTLGGHVTARLGRMPQRGDVIELAGHRVTVLEAQRGRIERLRIERPHPPARAEDGEEAEPDAEAGHGHA